MIDLDVLVDAHYFPEHLHALLDAEQRLFYRFARSKTISRVNSFEPRSMRSRCPFVIGSKDPDRLLLRAPACLPQRNAPFRAIRFKINARKQAMLNKSARLCKNWSTLSSRKCKVR